MITLKDFVEIVGKYDLVFNVLPNGRIMVSGLRTPHEGVPGEAIRELEEKGARVVGECCDALFGTCIIISP